MESSSRQESFPVPLPCLVVVHDGEGGEPCTTLLDISKGEYQYRTSTCNNVDMLRISRRWVTPQGWVLSWDPSTFNTFLWSPQTSEKIALPSLKTRTIHKYLACALSDKPTSNTGFTVVVAETDDTVIWYCHVGGTASCSGWARDEYYLGIYRIPVLSGSMPVDRVINGMAACRGRFYFVKSGAELGVLEFSPKPVPSVNRPAGTTYMPASCVELDGEVYVVSAFLRCEVGGDTVLGDGVYRMDFSVAQGR